MKENISSNINPEDEWQIKGGQQNLYEEAQANEDEEKGLSLYDHVSDEDIKTELGKEADYHIGMIFGLRTAIGLIAL